MLIRGRYEFSAAHALPGHAGACRRLHGHNYAVDIAVQGPIDPRSGMVMDFEHLDRIVHERAIAVMDHSSLNDLLENPTAEHIAVWIWRQLIAELPGLVEVAVFETPTCSAVYRGEHEP